MPTLTTIKDKYKHKKEQNKEYIYSDNPKYSWRRLYHDKRWTKLSQRILREHPICERCISDIPPRVTPSQEVHHIIPFRTGKNRDEQLALLLDESNLIALCTKCHKEYHRQYTRDKLYGKN